MRKIDSLDTAANCMIFAPQHNCERNAPHAINIFSFTYAPVSNIALSIFDNDERTYMWQWWTYIHDVTVTMRYFIFYCWPPFVAITLLSSFNCLLFSLRRDVEKENETTRHLQLPLIFTRVLVPRNINFNYWRKLLISIV